MTISIDCEDRQSVRLLIRKLNIYGFPGAWKARELILALILRLYDVWFVVSTLNKPDTYTYICNSHKFILRKFTSDRYVVDEVWSKNEYGQPPSGIAVDLGGNIGAFAIYASQRSERVLSFEPVESNFNMLKKNIAVNSTKNIEAFRAAVSNVKGLASINISPVNLGKSSLLGATHHGLAESIETTTLQQITEDHSLSRIDFLKCDIEGGEFKVFTYGARRALEKVGFIVMELHCGKVDHVRVYRLLRLLQRSGFRMIIKNANVPLLFLLGLGIVQFEKIPDSDNVQKTASASQQGA